MATAFIPAPFVSIYTSSLKLTTALISLSKVAAPEQKTPIAIPAGLLTVILVSSLKVKILFSSIGKL